MAGKVRVTTVSYLNTKPFLKGLTESSISDEIDLSLEMPSQSAEKLINGEADIGLVPVAAIPHLSNASIFTDYCIGCEGQVKTVCLFGNVSVVEMEKVLLDYQSRTSVELVKILFSHLWNGYPIYEAGEKGYEDQIVGTTGGVVIGDRTIDLRSKYNFVYDLGEAWHYLTGLPFVFAAWMTTTELSDDFRQRFNQALGEGVAKKEEVAQQFQGWYNNFFDVSSYYRDNINFELDNVKREAINIFLTYVEGEQIEDISQSLI